MPLHIVQNDITQMNVDAIVNSADPLLLGGEGGVDGCIHRAAGPGLLVECRTLGGCPTGSARLTAAYDLPCKYVIHTVAPRWQDGRHDECALLVSCYLAALALAEKRGCESVAFPLLSSGSLNYPREQALDIAIDTIGHFVLRSDMTVYLVVFDRAAYPLRGDVRAEIRAYINDRYVDVYAISQAIAQQEERLYSARMFDDSPSPSTYTLASLSLEEAVKQLDEGFSEMLLRKISESGMTDAQCYKRANIDRRLFSKIKNDKHYTPSKSTVIAFALALELPMEELREMLGKAGYSLTRACEFDIIVEYFVTQGIYNVFTINEALFAFDQNLIGV
jgi:O-acetyl-ADP-ribose deacetylase (regulator of RNase III)